MQRQKVLVDNSALRGFALRDPSAVATNRLMRKLGVVPVLTMFTVGEMLSGYISGRQNDEIRSRCGFVLSLDDLILMPDNVHTMWSEYLYGCGVDKQIDRHPEVLQTLQLLRACYDSTVPSHVLSSGEAYREATKHLYAEALENAVNHSSHKELKGCAYPDVVNPEQIVEVASILLNNESQRRGIQPRQERFHKACLNAGVSHSKAPLLCGSSRVNMWFHWYLANWGEVPKAFREDLKLLEFSLYADYVITADHLFFTHGPAIFPEVEFISTDRFVSLE